MKHSIKKIRKIIDFKLAITSSISTFICASVLSLSSLPIAVPVAQAQNSTLSDFSVLPETLAGDVVANPNILIILDNSGSMGRFTPNENLGVGNFRDNPRNAYVRDGITGTRYVRNVTAWDASSSMSNSFQVREAMRRVLSNPMFENRVNVGLMAFDTENCTYDPADNNALDDATANQISNNDLLYECRDANGNIIGNPERGGFDRATTGLGSLRANIANLTGPHRQTLLDLLAPEPTPWVNQPGLRNIGTVTRRTRRGNIILDSVILDSPPTTLSTELQDLDFIPAVGAGSPITTSNPLHGTLHPFLESSAADREIVGTEFPILSSPDNAYSNSTPLSGSIDSAFRYLLRNDTAVDTRAGLDTSRFANGLVDREISLVNSALQYPTTDQCEGDFIVILLTDGVASQRAPANLDTGIGALTGQSATSAATLDAAASAERLRLRGAANEAALGDDEPTIELFVIGFNLNGEGETSANLIAQAGSGGARDAIAADTPAEVEAAFEAIFSDALNETGSRSSVAIATSEDQALGSFIQPGFIPLMTQVDSGGVETNVSWTGELSNFFTDEFGNFREDTDGDGALTGADMGFFIDFDEGSELTHVIRFNVGPDGERTGLTGVANESNTTATEPDDPGAFMGGFIGLTDLNPIWSASDQLNALLDTESSVAQNRAYNSLPGVTGGRHILTSIDGSNSIPFVWSSSSGNANAIDPSEVGLFDLPEANNSISGDLLPAAEDLINFIRGFEGNDNFRNRTLANAAGISESFLLGDIVHSTPVQVEAPLLSAATSEAVVASFEPFMQRYIDRRRVVYVGANDGMLHAFNGGFWDGLDADDANPGQLSVSTTPLTGSGTNFQLGQELWAYVPRSVFPHLKFLSDPDYLADTHVSYVDGSMQAYDVKLFDNTLGNCEATATNACSTARYVNGWGTILVVGLRLGGAPYTGDLDNDSATPDQTTATSFLVFDVTDPEQAPELISEISNPGFNLGTVEPALVRTSVELDGDDPTIEYALVFGSGPTEIQSATVVDDSLPGLFVYELTDTSTTLDTSTTIAVAPVNTFLGGISTADWNGDDIDDAVYFGTIGGTVAVPTGQLYRGELSDTNSLSTQLLVSDTNGPVQEAPVIPEDQLLQDNKYILFGTGRTLIPDDILASYTEANLFAGIIDDVEISGGEVTFGNSTIAGDLTASSNILPTELDTNVLSDPDIIVAGGLDREDLLDEFGNDDDDTYQGWFFSLDTGTPRMSGAPFTFSTLAFFTHFEPQSVEDVRAEDTAQICLPSGAGFLSIFDYRIGIVPDSDFITDATDIVAGTDLDSLTNIQVSNGLLAGGQALIVGIDEEGNTELRLKNSGGDGSFGEIEIGLAGSGGFGPGRNFGRTSWREITIPE